jgi:tRNA modification GTPase
MDCVSSLAGPPNSGKSTLLNALVAREAAIVSDVAGTTRDLIEVPVALEGIAFLFTDTAGLRDDSSDSIEAIGIERAAKAIAGADMVLWLGAEGEGPKHPESDRELRPRQIWPVISANRLH